MISFRALIGLVAAVVAFLALLANWDSINTSAPPSTETCRPRLANELNVGRPKEEIDKAFTHIYNTSFWSNEGGGSGPGSTLDFTAGIRTYIADLVRREKLRGMMDIPCGAAFWIPALLEAIRKRDPCFEYVGVDVVAPVIERNKARHRGDPLTSFFAADVSVTKLPHRPDLILSRDALQHIPIKDAINVLENIAKAKPKFAMIGSYMNTENVNVPAGGYFDINLLAPPFNLPPPRSIAKESADPKGLHPQKYSMVYTGDMLAKVDFERMKRDAVEKMVNGRFPNA